MSEKLHAGIKPKYVNSQLLDLDWSFIDMGEEKEFVRIAFPQTGSVALGKMGNTYTAPHYDKSLIGATAQVKMLQEGLTDAQKRIVFLMKLFNGLAKEKNYDKIKRIGESKEYKISEKIIARSTEFILSTQLKFQPEIFPTGDETVQAEFITSEKDYLEVEVLEDKYEVFIDSKTGEKEENYTELNEVINRVNEFYTNL